MMNMDQYQLAYNRRKEWRYYYKSGCALAWCRDGKARRRRRGWLNETSMSGLSFYVETTKRPSVGDDIVINDWEGTDVILCHVVRVMPLDKEMSLVGCRKDIDASTRLTGRPKDRLTTAVCLDRITRLPLNCVS